ncbi:MAG: hypothetical protein CL687_05355 [Candidatus Pelagibacter sp.]|nr:hypothetical protein [Candidatus Pelagibacter sp.]|tara:strand:+ start:5359 stop:5727 length:369 start_codon:yes stop_codon:yes gene_type:complete
MSSNRSFGILFFIVFIIIGLWPIKNSDSPNYVFLGIALIFLILGLVNSKALTPINKLWIKFGELLGKIIAPIIMAIVFFIILTPVGLLMRVIGKDLINLKFNKKQTYWIKRKKQVGTMDKQF